MWERRDSISRRDSESQFIFVVMIWHETDAPETLEIPVSDGLR